MCQISAPCPLCEGCINSLFSEYACRHGDVVVLARKEIYDYPRCHAAVRFLRSGSVASYEVLLLQMAGRTTEYPTAALTQTTAYPQAIHALFVHAYCFKKWQKIKLSQDVSIVVPRIFTRSRKRMRVHRRLAWVQRRARQYLLRAI